MLDIDWTLLDSDQFQTIISLYPLFTGKTHARREDLSRAGCVDALAFDNRNSFWPEPSKDKYLRTNLWSAVDGDETAFSAALTYTPSLNSQEQHFARDLLTTTRFIFSTVFQDRDVIALRQLYR
jgi:hypothetical protein